MCCFRLVSRCEWGRVSRDEFGLTISVAGVRSLMA